MSLIKITTILSSTLENKISKRLQFWINFYNVFQKVSDNVSDGYSLVVFAKLQSCYFILFFILRWEFTPKPEFRILTFHTRLSHGTAYGHSGAVASNSLQCIETRMALSRRSDLVGPVMSPLNYRKLQRNVLFQLPQPFVFEHAWHDLKGS
jgi:hypothetical protein